MSAHADHADHEDTVEGCEPCERLELYGHDSGHHLAEASSRCPACKAGESRLPGEAIRVRWACGTVHRDREAAKRHAQALGGKLRPGWGTAIVPSIYRRDRWTCVGGLLP